MVFFSHQNVIIFWPPISTFKRGNGVLQKEILITFFTPNSRVNQERRFWLKPGIAPGFGAKPAQSMVFGRSSLR